MAEAPDGDSALSFIDETIHAKARLGIMALLVAEGRADFPWLRRQLGLTDGNLGAHMRVLEESGYVEVEKGFVGRRSRTVWTVTEAGRAAFRRYLEGMERLLRAAAAQADGPGRPD